jgi:6-phosphogluconolactonase
MGRLPIRSAWLLVVATALCPVAAAPAQRSFIYTNDNATPNTVSAFSVSTSGALLPLPGSPFPTNGNSLGGGLPAADHIVTVGDRLYVTNTASRTIGAFAIDPSTGTLSPIGSPFAMNAGNVDGDISLAATPDGRFLFAGSEGPMNVTVFAIGSDGSLTTIGDSPFRAGGTPAGMTVSPDGRFLAVALPDPNTLRGTVAMFAIADDGQLTPVPGSPFPNGGLGGNPGGVDIDCASARLFVGEANSSGTVVDVLTIASNGTLTPVPGSPFIEQAGVDSNFVLLDPDGGQLFVSNEANDSVTVFDVQSNGSLTPIPGSPFPVGNAGSGANGMAMTVAGPFLYVADFHEPEVNEVAVFRTGGTNGPLTQVLGSPFRTARPGDLLSLVAFPAATCELATIAARIDVKPAKPQNPINPESQKRLRVAILTTAALDASAVDPRTVRFGPGAAPPTRRPGPHLEDVNDDGEPDLVLRFQTGATGIRCGDTSVALAGTTFRGDTIEGSDSIRTVGCP